MKPNLLSLFQSSYEFEGASRLSYFLWSNPNHAAIVIAASLALVWPLERLLLATSPASRLIGCGFQLLEITGVYALTLTYSRGGLLAMLCGLVFYTVTACLCLPVGSPEKRRRYMVFIWRLLLVGAVVVWVGVDRRLSQVAEGDPSAVNRLGLWASGLQLVYARPLAGWGLGTSGYNYIQWIQDSFTHIKPHGMVNTYIELSVDYGLAVTAGYVFLNALLLWLFLDRAFHGKITPDFNGLGWASSVVVFSIGSFFSTTCYAKGVMWLEALYVAIAVWSVFKARQSSPAGEWLLSTVRKGLVCALAVSALIYLAGALSTLQASSYITYQPDGGVKITKRRVSPEGMDLTVCTDKGVLGPFYGRVIRDAFEVATSYRSVTIYQNTFPEFGSERGEIILVGRRAAWLDRIPLTHRVGIIVPTAWVPPVQKREMTFLVLAGVDDRHRQKRWLFADGLKWGLVLTLKDSDTNIGYKLRVILPLVSADENHKA